MLTARDEVRPPSLKVFLFKASALNMVGVGVPINMDDYS